METTSASASASASDAENAGEQTETMVPLLLSPAYARSKSVVNDELRSFRVCLKCCLLDHSSLCALLLSFSAFLLLTFLVPLATSFSIFTTTTPTSILTFNRLAQLPTSGLATISFMTLAAFFRSFGGLRRLLFLDDGMQQDSSLVRRRYALEINKAFRRHLVFILLPSFSLELVHKITLFSSGYVRVPFFPDAMDNNTINNIPWRVVVFLFMLVSWIYRTALFLLLCVLFRLTCELQILRFQPAVNRYQLIS